MSSRENLLGWVTVCTGRHAADELEDQQRAAQ